MDFQTKRQQQTMFVIVYLKVNDCSHFFVVSKKKKEKILFEETKRNTFSSSSMDISRKENFGEKKLFSGDDEEKLTKDERMELKLKVCCANFLI